jgi:hypothetical protein
MATGQDRQKEVTHHLFSVLRFLSVLFLDFSLPLRRFPGLLFLSWFKWDMAVFQCCAADMAVFQCCAADMAVFQCCAADMAVFQCCAADMVVFQCCAADMAVFQCCAADMVVFQCCAADMVVFQCCAADMAVFQCCASAKVAVLGSAGKKDDFPHILSFFLYLILYSLRE